MLFEKILISIICDSLFYLAGSSTSSRKGSRPSVVVKCLLATDAGEDKEAAAEGVFFYCDGFARRAPLGDRQLPQQAEKGCVQAFRSMAPLSRPSAALTHDRRTVPPPSQHHRGN